MDIENYYFYHYSERRQKILSEFWSHAFKDWGDRDPEIYQIFESHKEFLESSSPYLRELQERCPKTLKDMWNFVHRFPKFERTYIDNDIDKKDLCAWFKRICQNPREIAENLFGPDDGSVEWAGLCGRLFSICGPEADEYKTALKRIVKLVEDPLN